MPSVADYAVLNDGTFDLNSGQEKELTPFFPPSGFVKGTNLAKAVLAYKARPLPNAPFSPQAELKITMKFQNLSVEQITIRDDTVRGLWEAFSAAEFSTTVGNVFIFRAVSGRVRISDVILWYQVQV